MRNAIAIVCSILCFLTVYLGLGEIADFLGVETYVHFDETIVVNRGMYDEEIEGDSTDVGMYVLFVAVMLSVRLYLWLKVGSIDGGMSQNAKQLWSYWFLGVSLYILTTTPIYYLDLPFFLELLLQLTVIIAIAAYFFARYTRRIEDAE